MHRWRQSWRVQYSPCGLSRSIYSRTLFKHCYLCCSEFTSCVVILLLHPFRLVFPAYIYEHCCQASDSTHALKTLRNKSLSCIGMVGAVQGLEVLFVTNLGLGRTEICERLPEYLPAGCNVHQFNTSTQSVSARLGGWYW